MKVNIIQTEKFYPTMLKWWRGQKEVPVNPAMLPEKTFVVYNDKGEETHSMCFYNTDSNLCWFGWPLANPDIKKEDKKGCLRHLVSTMEKCAKNLGYQILFTTSKTPAVIHTLEKSDFVLGDVDVNHYIKIIN